MFFGPGPAVIDGAALPADAAAADIAADGGDWSFEALLDMPPGPAAMALLASIDPAGLDDAGRIAVMTAWERQASWVSAQCHAATVAVAGTRPVDRDDFARAEVAAVLRMSGRAAQGRIETARLLATRLTGTLAMLQAGTLSTRQVWAIADEAAAMPDEPSGWAALEERVLPAAPAQTTSQLRRAVRRAIHALFPADEHEAHETARKQRDVVLAPQPHGMASVIATLTAPEARALFLAVDALARGRHQAEGGRASGVGIGARRADALVALADAALADRALPRAHRRPIELQVLIELPTLLGLAHKPAELAGYGPITPEVARELAADATWRRLVIEPVTGHLLDFGQTTYRPPQALADYLANRDRACRIPGCARPAHRCDHDHITPYNKNGPTNADNCWCLCRRHHRLKTLGHWKVKPHTGGHATLTTASGLTYQLHPPDQRAL